MRFLFSIAIVLLAGCSSGDSPSNPLATSSNLKRGPYLQLGGTDSMLIVWQTFSTTQTVLEYGLDESLTSLVETGEIGTEHSVLLTGLEPNANYYYSVGDGESRFSRMLQFRTHPATDDASFRFLVFGDSGSPGPALLGVANLVNASSAAFALHTGDVVYPNGEEHLYDASFFHPFAQFLASRVMYPTLGNHDLLTEDGAPYLSNFHLPTNNPQATERYYSFDYANAHFVALDTTQPTAPGSMQRAWLEQDLATTTKRWKFVFFHHPPYSAGFHFTGTGSRSDLVHTRIRRDFVPLFERYGVNIVFAGHAHSYERTFPILLNRAVSQEQEPDYVDPVGPVYIVTGGGGGELTRIEPHELNAVGTADFHIVEISLAGDELTGRAVALPGIAVDRFSITLR